MGIPLLSRPNFPGAIELGQQRADELFLAVARAGFARADIKLDAADFVEQPDDPPWKPFRIGHTIGRQPLLQILRAPHVKHAFPLAAHEIRLLSQT